MAISAERGRAAPSCGHALIAVGRAGSLRAGCGLGRLAGVLDTQEHRARVRGELDARDFATDWAGQKAADLAARGIGGQQLVVSDVSQSALAIFSADESVRIQRTPRASKESPSGCANATPPWTSPRLIGSVLFGSPHSSQRRADARVLDDGNYRLVYCREILTC
jgi:hypothetical protein